ncbi:Pyridoxamine 5'-phosphate oxidase [Alloactinosynnema sp. L-07]|uniref:pyridoxamine 5'-phosphate oxidase family protein n=1 Tax=Alloactinosynnema sp. L-07 TaxID=1653480 RepID=UPI00065EF69B|nr:pyridoxamine 5'-phosphate oxidase family protein [Alloactinosynnema sp. L-07]CRK62015.1 Pyridoxamine 5'-phosphate oxidase [Alloactinosynnema sp. L-07]
METNGTTGIDYHPGQRELQDQFDTRRIADRISQRLVHHVITENDREFVEARDMVFLATVGPDGQPTCSYKGGDPGFVRVVDEHTLAMPSYDGNGMFLSLGNIAAGSPVGLLFIDFENGGRTRVQGTATIAADDSLLETWPGALLVMRVQVTHVFPNCGRYVHHYALVERSTFVPRRRQVTPVPSWKRADWACDALPANDPANDPGDLPVRWR